LFDVDPGRRTASEGFPYPCLSTGFEIASARLMTHSFIPILLMLLAAVALAGGFLGLNWVVGRHQRNPSKLSPYESGVPMLDTNRKRVNVRFYQIAMLFILFDIEAAFLYPWAVIYRDASRGNAGMFLFGEMLVFIALLGVGYVYVWKKKAFDWK
jgi:NADH-quinone oxidoreductase subunit A